MEVAAGAAGTLATATTTGTAAVVCAPWAGAEVGGLASREATLTPSFTLMEATRSVALSVNEVQACWANPWAAAAIASAASGLGSIFARSCLARLLPRAAAARR